MTTVVNCLATVVLDASVCGGSWCLDPSLSPFLVKVHPKFLNRFCLTILIRLSLFSRLVVHLFLFHVFLLHAVDCDIFTICVDCHSVGYPFSAEDPLVNKRCNATFLHICVLQKNSASWMVWGDYILRKLNILHTTVPGCAHHRGPLLDYNTAALAKKAQQRLYFLRKLRRARAPTPIMCTFYRGTIESILTSCITVWYGACNASCRKSLQRIVRAAEKIVGVSLPSLQDIYSTRLTRKALSIAGDPTQLLQSAAIREETAESPGEDQQTEGQLHPSGCQEAELPPVLAPPPLFYPTQHWTLTLLPMHVTIY